MKMPPTMNPSSVSLPLLMLISPMLFIFLDWPCWLHCAPIRPASAMFPRPMKPVRANAGLHVVAPEPDRASASEWRIAGSKDDLFVGAHAQHFMRLDRWPRSQLLRSRARQSFGLRTAADLVDLDRCHAAATRDVIGSLRIVDRGKRDPAGTLEPLAGGVATAIGFAHLSD